MLGSYGMAILVVSLLAAGAIVGAYVLAYAAHCFLTVLEQTAAGSKHIDWPDEPFHDWIWKAFYLLWLTAIWLVPVSFLMRTLDWPLTSKLLLAGALMMLVFPVTLLSSLGSSSKLILVNWTVLRRWFRLGLALPLFYLTLGLILAVTGMVVRFGMTGWQSFREEALAAGPGWLAIVLDFWSWLVVLPVTALVAAIAMLSVARLIGRLGHLLRQVRFAAEGEVEEADDDEVDEEPMHAQLIPAALPTVAAPVQATNGEVFGLVEDGTPAPPILVELPRSSRLPNAPDPTVRRPVEPQSSSLLDGTTFAFLGQRQTWGVLAWLTVGGGVLAAIIRVQILIWPF